MKSCLKSCKDLKSRIRFFQVGGGGAVEKNFAVTEQRFVMTVLGCMSSLLVIIKTHRQGLYKRTS